MLKCVKSNIHVKYFLKQCPLLFTFPENQVTDARSSIHRLKRLASVDQVLFTVACLFFFLLSTLFAFYFVCFVSFIYIVCTLFTFLLTTCCSLLLVCASFATWCPQKRCFLSW